MDSIRYEKWRDSGLKRNDLRLTQARQRRKRQKHIFIALAVALLVALLFFWWVRRDVPAAPLPVVRWPMQGIYQTVSNGSRFASRAGQVLTVSVSESQKWNCQWIDGQNQLSGAQLAWKPDGQAATLNARCRARGAGMQRIAAAFWPVRQLSLIAVPIVMTANQRATFSRTENQPDEMIWMAPHTVAPLSATWDERVVPLLALVVEPVLKGSLKLAVPTMPSAAAENESKQKILLRPDEPMWEVVPSFDGKKPAASDLGTYLKLNSTQPEKDLPLVAQLMAQAQPKASLKFIVRLDEEKPLGILRIALDGKGERRGWLKRPGEGVAGSFEWDVENPATLPLPPAPPSARR